MGLLIGKKTLFVHIPKTGGTTMVRNFKSAYGASGCEWEGNHCPLNYLHEKCKIFKLDPDDLHVVSIVRNPWTKMFSTWRYFSTIDFNEFYSGDESIDSDFNKWVKWVYTDFNRNKADRGEVKFNMYKYHFTEQLNWFKDDAGNTLKVDNILKTENLTKQMNDIAERYGFKHTIIRTNKTQNKEIRDDIYSVINQESIDLIGEAFKGDLTAFEYDYEGE